jgi:hypothetical protein
LHDNTVQPDEGQYRKQDIEEQVFTRERQNGSGEKAGEKGEKPGHAEMLNGCFSATSMTTDEKRRTAIGGR